MLAKIEIAYADLWRIGAGSEFDLFGQLKLNDYITNGSIGETREFQIHLERKEAPAVFESEGIRLKMQMQNTDPYRKSMVIQHLW